MGGGAREELLTAVADGRRGPHFQLGASLIKKDFPTRGVIGSGRKVGKSAVARREAPWENEGAERRRQEQLLDSTEGVGPPPATGSRPPCKGEERL